MQNLLFIGGTGYIGGPILSSFLEKNDPNFNITALVRSAAKADKLRALNMKLNIVSGSHDDAELVERISADADAVFSLADSDNLQATETILRGLKKRFETTGIKPTLIHMSGTGTVADEAKGTLSEKIYNDMNIAEIEALPATQPHRNVDLAIVDADTQGYIYSYVVIPGIVFGPPRGILAEARVQNPKNLGFTLILSASFGRRSAGFIGAGTNRIAVVDVTDTTDIVEIVYNAAAAGSAAHGKQGYYFVTNGDVAWGEIADVVVTRAGARSPFTQDDLDKYFPGMPGMHSLLGNNGRAHADRSRALGWKPVKTTDDFFAAVRDDVEHWDV
ncbi:hypothetical protein DFH06DRAFT_1392243 [Mycena polygramma]|nr:hypothetical protein DFH06DRAFT_1392243 [Mycena polygramma]